MTETEILQIPIHIPSQEEITVVLWGMAVYFMGVWAISSLPFFLLGGTNAILFNQEYFGLLFLIWTSSFLIGGLIYGLTPQREHKKLNLIIESVQDFFRNGIVQFGILLLVGFYIIILVTSLVRL